jgi:serine/threonine-protein kinase RsbW
VHLRFRSTLADVARVAEHLRGRMPAGLSAPEQDAVELGITEALTNIVRHGTLDPDEPVELHWTERPGRLEIEIVDRGQAIPEHRLRDAGPSTFDFDETDIGGLPEGGMGLALIKAAFDHIDYRSDGGENHLHLIKLYTRSP